MKRLVLLLALVAVALRPGAARPAACSPLNCAPSQFTVGGGGLLAVRGSVESPVRVLDLRTGATRWRLPAGIVSGRHARPPGRAPRHLVRRRPWNAFARRDHSRPHGAFGLVGLSQGGEWAVLQRTQKRSTTLRCCSRPTRRARSSSTEHVVVRRAPRRQALPDQAAQERLPGAALRSRREHDRCRDRSRTRTARRRSGAFRSRGPRRRTAGCCSRSTSAVTAARWCTSSTSLTRPRAASTCPATGTSAPRPRMPCPCRRTAGRCGLSARATAGS